MGKHELSEQEIVDQTKEYLAGDEIYNKETKTFYYSLGSYKLDNAVFLMIKNDVPHKIIEDMINGQAEMRKKKKIVRLTLKDREEVGYANEHIYAFGENDEECHEAIMNILKEKEPESEVIHTTTGYLDRYSLIPNTTAEDMQRGINIRNSRIGWGAFSVLTSIVLNFSGTNFNFVCKSPVMRAYHNRAQKMEQVKDALKRAKNVKLDKKNIKRRFLAAINNDEKFIKLCRKGFPKKDIEDKMSSSDSNVEVLKELMEDTDIERVNLVSEAFYDEIVK